MNVHETNLNPEYEIRALGGFLDGLSFLNKNQRPNSATAFSIKARDEGAALSELKAAFSHLPTLELEFDQRFDENPRQLEQDIRSLLLMDAHVADEGVAENLRSYLSFKIMDRLDDISDRQKSWKCKRILGKEHDAETTMVFYWLRTQTVSFVLYFLTPAKPS